MSATLSVRAVLARRISGPTFESPSGKLWKKALPFQISRHSHPKARPEVPAEPPTPTTGIDYLGLIDARHTAELAGKVNYSALAPEPPVRDEATEPGTSGQEQL